MTRPGVAAIASALLVEIFVSILQHPDGGQASATSVQSGNQTDHPLGIVPHQIRGYLSTFENVIVHGECYDKCSACSNNILQAYSRFGWEFVKKALDQKGYVEEISGLAEVSDLFPYD